MYTETINKCAANAARINRFERSDKLGFYAKSDSSISSIEKPADVAGKKIIVGSGTNQESILLARFGDV